MRLLVTLLLIAASHQAAAFDLATRITQDGETTRLETAGYARLVLLKRPVSAQGAIFVTGRLAVEGTASVVLWAKVAGRYYFSKLPALQNVRDQTGLEFRIPFDAGDDSVTEVLIEVEMPAAGSLSLGGLELHRR